MRRYATKIVLLAAVCALGPGSRASAESLFAINFIGERIEAGDVRSIALGGASQLIADSLGVLQLNPAMLTYARRVTFGASQHFTVDQGESVEFREREVSTKFTALGFVFPPFDRVSVGLGYRSRYDADGSFITAQETQVGDAYDEQFTRKGSLFSIPFTVAVDVGRLLKLGVTYSIERGSVESRWDVIFDSDELEPAASRKKESLSGTGFAVGAVFSPVPSLMLGATYESEIDYDSEINESHTNNINNKNFNSTLKLPERWTAALTWRVAPPVAIYASGSVRDFSKFEGLEFDGTRQFKEEVGVFGVEYLEGFRIRRTRFPVRASVVFERLPYDFPVGKRIDVLLFGFGTGLHLRGGRAKLDFAVHAGKAGDIATNGLKNQMVRLYVGLSGSEMWQRKRTSPY